MSAENNNSISTANIVQSILKDFDLDKKLNARSD